jgi:DNA-binding NarL/FixJ family response regulator
MAPFIVVVEDDHLQDGPLQELLREQFPTARIEALFTERDFRTRLDGFRRDPPDVVIMDVMMRWANPRPGDPPPPPDVLTGGYRRAGIRCVNLMAHEPALCDVPVIYYTILERSDLERDAETLTGNVFLIRKSSDRQPLTRKIRELTSADRQDRSRRLGSRP